jgi:hypothetical protein
MILIFELLEILFPAGPIIFKISDATMQDTMGDGVVHCSMGNVD